MSTRPAIRFGLLSGWRVRAALAHAAVLHGAVVFADPAADPVAEPPPAAPSDPAPTQGMLPIPDYSGELFIRRYLTGDWGGARSDLADNGIQFGADWHQYVQGVTSGGSDRTTRYGGSLDYTLSFDLMRMNVLPGALVKLRAETRYGHSVNAQSGSILPVNTDMLFPSTDPADDEVPIALTTLSYLQMLSSTFGIVLGKMDTLDGDANEFASGRGVSQFMNSNMVFNSALALRLPYSTLGAGVVWLPTDRIVVSSTLLNTVDSSTTTGFSDIGDGLTWSSEARFQYRLGSLPGGVNAGALYSFDQDFAEISGRLVFRPGEGLILPSRDETWAVYFSGWQYLWVKDESNAERPVDLSDGMPDHQGIGLFCRVGFADEDTNPVDWTLSGGIGGRGIIPTREHDHFGIGYFYTSLQADRLTSTDRIRDHTEGFEAFYSIALTPAARFTVDVQAIDSLSTANDTSIVLGCRLSLSF